jgi:hypothetical protein
MNAHRHDLSIRHAGGTTRSDASDLALFIGRGVRDAADHGRIKALSGFNGCGLIDGLAVQVLPNIVTHGLLRKSGGTDRKCNDGKRFH